MLSWWVFGILTALLAASAAVVGKHTLFREHAMEFSATLAVFVAAIMLPFVVMIDFAAIPGYAYALMLLTSMLGATAFLFVSKAMRHLPISVSSPLMAIGPAFAAILAFLFLGERLSIANLFGLLLIITGVFVLQQHRGVSIKKNLKVIIKEKYVRFILISLALYAGCSVIDRHVMGPLITGGLAIPPIDYLVIVNFMIAVAFLVMHAYFHDGIQGIKHGVKNAWIPIFIIALLTVGYRLTGAYALSLADGKAALVVGLKRTSALFTTIVGGELFHEKHMLRRIIAACIIICGALLIIV